MSQLPPRTPWDDDEPPSLSGAAESARLQRDGDRWPETPGRYLDDRERNHLTEDLGEMPAPPRRRPAEQVVYTGHPHWRAMIGYHIKWFGIVAIATALGYAVSMSGVIALGWVVLASLLGFAAVWFIGKLIRQTTIYHVSNRRVRKQWGIVAKHQEEAPLRRVQNISVDISIIQRILGVGTIDFDTASGTDPADKHLLFWGVRDPVHVRSLIHLDLDVENDLT
ncbi:PH domain-containing protein [Miltoncostaea oceani]|uniref:PH domain-containing protein n=1 Tax=Miltoncostaea oceani TaxID=2843216 RepID=UPI001C3D5FBC|nr:PH domain-containing protein [Miltoncostaea oceani]